ncbi:DUF397 domain-containing protein [Streptomyces tauricus]|uniref:DUF397 domain-containing protein n=1 Tax=Streptomyces tauricus TaxID=68274 RepID=A0ABZ1JY01_9ACTN
MRAGYVLARDSKTPVIAVLHFTAVTWAGFLRALSQGELQGS